MLTPTSRVMLSRFSEHLVVGINGTSNDARPKPNHPQPNSVEPEKRNELVEQLSRGIIPDVIREELRIIDSRTSHAKSFEAEVLALYSELVKGTHLQNRPLPRILLCDIAEPNAFFLKGSNPPMYGFTSGLFREEKIPDWFLRERNRGEHQEIEIPALGRDRIVGRPVELAYLLLHEMLHREEEAERGRDHAVGKLEESKAYIAPLERMSKLGMNVQYARYVLAKLLPHSYRADAHGEFCSEPVTIPGIIDPHPLSHNILEGVRDAVAAYVSRSCVFPDKPFSQAHPIIQASSAATYVGYIERAIAKNVAYDGAPLAQKVDTLSEIFSTAAAQDQFSVKRRFTDFARQINKLAPLVKNAEDRKTIVRFIDRLVAITSEHKCHSGFSTVYFAATSLLGTPMKPVGRIKTITDAIAGFASAATDPQSSDTTITRASLSMKHALDGDPINREADFAFFLRRITGSVFALPNLHEVEHFTFTEGERLISQTHFEDESEQDDVDGEPHYNSNDPHSEDLGDWNPSIQETEATQVDWRHIYPLCKSDPLILEMAIRAGLGTDENIAEAWVLKHGNQYRTIDALNQGYRALLGLSLVPEPTNQDEVLLSNLVIHPDGEVGQVRVSQDDVVRRQFRKERSGFANYSLTTASIGPFQKVQKAMVERAFLRNDRNTVIAFCEMFGAADFSLLFSDLAERNIPLFVEINSPAAFANFDLGTKFIGRLSHIIREYPELKATVCKQLLSAPEHSGLVSIIQNWIAPIETEKKNIRFQLRLDPISSFVLRDPSRLFTAPQQARYLHNIKDIESSDILEDSIFLDDDTKNNRQRFYVGLADTLLEPYQKMGHLGAERSLSWETISALLPGANKSTPATSSEPLHLGLVLRGLQKIQYNQMPDLDQLVIFATSADRLKLSLSRYYRSISRHTEREFPKISASRNIEDTSVLWKNLADRGLFNPESKDRFLTEITRRLRIEKLSPEIRWRTAETLLRGTAIELPKAKRDLIECWAQAVRQTLEAEFPAKEGRDDGTGRYTRRTTTIIRSLNKGKKVNVVDRIEMLSALAKELNIQRETARAFEKNAVVALPHDGAGTTVCIGFGEAFVDVVRQNPKARETMMKFLLSKGDHSAIDECIDGLENHLGLESLARSFGTNIVEDYDLVRRDLKQEHKLPRSLMVGFENFWAAPVLVRALVTKRLLLSPGETLTREDKRCFDFVMNQLIAKGDSRAEILKEMAFARLLAVHPTRREIELSALLVGARLREYGALSLGDALANAIEASGDPILVKTAQRSASLPNCPPDIRNPFQRLKTKASEPPRWISSSWIDDVEKEIEAEYTKSRRAEGYQGPAIRITYRGELLGSASIYVISKLIMSDGYEVAVAIRRPHAIEDCNEGFATTQRMLVELRRDHPVWESLREVQDTVASRIDLETDPLVAPAQYQRGASMLNGLNVKIEGHNFEQHVVKVFGAGVKQITPGDIRGFYIMEVAPGTHFIDLPESDPEYRRLAAMSELVTQGATLATRRGDDDRHGGQMKFVRISPTRSRVYQLDMKALPLEDFRPEESFQVARLMIEALKGRQGRDLGEVVVQGCERIRESDKVILTYLRALQSASVHFGEYTPALRAGDLGKIGCAIANFEVDETLRAEIHQQLLAAAPELLGRVAKRGDFSAKLSALVRNAEGHDVIPGAALILPLVKKLEDANRVKKVREILIRSSGNDFNSWATELLTALDVPVAFSGMAIQWLKSDSAFGVVAGILRTVVDPTNSVTLSRTKTSVPS